MASYDYTYFDGQNWSNIYSAKDGRGVIELNPGAITDNLRLKSEYEYRGEAHIDSEIDAVMSTVRGQAFRKSYINVSGDTPSVAATREAEAAIETAPVTNAISIYQTTQNTAKQSARCLPQ